MRFFDWLFTKFLILFAKFIRLFVPKPKYGEVDLNKIDKDNL